MPDSARGSSADGLLTNEPDHVWPADGLNVLPDGSIPAPAIYEREVERIFRGRSWNFVALEGRAAEPGCFKRSFVGPTPVVVARDQTGRLNVFENRCAHRGAELCRAGARQGERAGLPLSPMDLRPGRQPRRGAVPPRQSRSKAHADRVPARGS